MNLQYKKAIETFFKAAQSNPNNINNWRCLESVCNNNKLYKNFIGSPLEITELNLNNCSSPNTALTVNLYA